MPYGDRETGAALSPRVYNHTAPNSQVVTASLDPTPFPVVGVPLLEAAAVTGDTPPLDQG